MNGKKQRWILLAPVVAVLLLLFGGGLGIAFLQSAGYFEPMGEASFTLRHYTALWSDREARASLLVTCRVAAIATLLSVFAGLTIALALHRLAARSRGVHLLLQIPLAMPHLTMATMVLQAIAPGGLAARLAYHLGWISEPGAFPLLVSDANNVGVILAYFVKETPFIALMTLAVRLRMGDEFEAVARTLGAGPWQRFRRVTLPLLAPALVSSSLLVFAFILGAFEIPYLLGRPYPAMLSVVAQRRYLDPDLSTRPGAIAVAMMLSLLTLVAVWLYLRLTRFFLGTNASSHAI
jgi:putative spermidine/putrescine transport system permease protein